MSELRHRVLIIGLGSIGERHVRCFRSLGSCELVICEPNLSVREKIQDRYSIDEAFPDLEAALAGRAYDCAVIAAPAPVHIPLATQLARRGIHLLIEKPLSISMSGVEPLRQLVKEKALIAAVGYSHRAHPACRKLKDGLASGQFGQPRQLVVCAGQHFPTYRPAYRETYYADRQSGGGAIQDAMTHMYNLGEWFIGPIDQLVTDAAHLAIADVAVEDTVHTLARHGKVMGSYALNQHQAPNETTITIVCERGTCRAEYRRQRWSWVMEPDTPWQHEAVEIPDRDSIYAYQARVFLDAVAGKTSPLCSLEDGIQTLRVNLASLRSADTRSWQQVNTN